MRNDYRLWIIFSFYWIKLFNYDVSRQEEHYDEQQLFLHLAKCSMAV
jgi:hypothetical protein